jgi:hypothetical protein
MTSLRPRMTEDMQVRNLALNTQTSYLQQVSLFARPSSRRIETTTATAASAYPPTSHRCGRGGPDTVLGYIGRYSDYRKDARRNRVFRQTGH